jgi:hypothetical protein
LQLFAPVQARELKHALAAADLASRRFAGARGLKLIVAGQRYSGPASSRLRARGLKHPLRLPGRRPGGFALMRARGLKPLVLDAADSHRRSRPCAACVETLTACGLYLLVYGFDKDWLLILEALAATKSPTPL